MSNCTCVECMPDSQEPTFDELIEVVKEKQATIEQQATKIAELEAIIADWNRRCEAGNNKLDWLDAVERVAELEAIIKERYSLWLIYFDDQDRRPEMFTDKEPH